MSTKPRFILTEEIRQQARHLMFRQALQGSVDRADGLKVETLQDHGIEPDVTPEASGQFSIYLPQIDHDHAVIDALAEGKAEPVFQPPVVENERDRILDLARKFSGAQGSSESIVRANKVLSTSTTSVTYGHSQNEGLPKMGVAFDEAVLDPERNDDPALRDVNAVRMVMENIFDWDYHERHHGDTVTYDHLTRLEKSLRQNLKTVCPSVEDEVVVTMFIQMALSNRLGDLDMLRRTTEDVVKAYLGAQNGDEDALPKLEHRFAGMIAYLDKFYPDHNTRAISLRDVAKALENAPNVM